MIIKYFLLLNVCAVVSNAANNFKIESVGEAYNALLVTAEQVRCAGAIAQAQDKCAQELKANSMCTPWYKGEDLAYAADIQKRCDSKIRSIESNCAAVLKKLGAESVDTNLYAGKSVLDLFVAKAHVGLDELLVKAYKLHNADSVEKTEAEELMTAVSAALLAFEKQVSETVFDDLFSPLFRESVEFSQLKKNLVSLCLAPNVREGFDVLQAAFELGNFVLNARGLDTSADLGVDDLSEIDAQVLEALIKGDHERHPYIVMNRKVSSYAYEAQSMQKRIDQTAELLHARERDLLLVRNSQEIQKQSAIKGQCRLIILPLMNEILAPTEEMTPIGLDEAPRNFDVIQKHCEELKKIEKELSACYVQWSPPYDGL